MMNSERALHREAVVFGDTVAAFSAAVALRLDGRSVLWVTRHTGILREAAWGLLRQARGGHGRVWELLESVLSEKGALRGGQVDGACAEVLAARIARTVGVEIQMFAAPCKVDSVAGRIAEIGFLAKGAFFRLSADMWVDASMGGEIVRLCGGVVSGLGTGGWCHSVVFRHASPRVDDPESFFRDIEGIDEAVLGPGTWPSESVLSYREPTGRPFAGLTDVLRRVRTILPVEEAFVTHASLVPVPYAPDECVLLPGNITLARPRLGGRDFSELIDAGECAARSVSAGVDRPSFSPPALSGEARQTFDVVVAGLGTGGALAALAAAREGSRVGAMDVLPTLGGVGTSGGIHLYYFGVQGGLQSEVDARIKSLGPLFATRRQVAGFHPVAKMCALSLLLEEAGVTILTEAVLGEVTVHNQRVEGCDVLAASGSVHWSAEAWVDATGDADLAAAAGVPWQGSPRIDGVSSAFTQASGWVAERDGHPYLRIVNFDTGYVDALDAADLTRARLAGLEHYEADTFTDHHRPTLIAPQLGVRQSRQIQAEYMITLADLAQRATFPDTVGFTACHLDSHAVDFEFEPLEITFWIWGCRNWRVRTACEIPYRTLLPRALKNVLIGCRAIGVTPEAHQSVRMQRDMQRVGEVAGLAAAFVSRFGIASRAVPLPWLHERLKQSGALEMSGPEGTDFGRQVVSDELQPGTHNLAALFESIRSDFGPHMYLLTLLGDEAIPGLRELLRDPAASWRAAVVLAMLGDSAAEDRLVRAVVEREVGFSANDPRHPERCQRLAPNWLAALSFLRNCGSHVSLAAAENVLRSEGVIHNAKTSCALLAAAIVSRFPGEQPIRRQAARILALLRSDPADNAIGAPQRNILGTGMREGDPAVWYPHVVEDFQWQLDFVRVRLATVLDHPIEADWIRHLNDPRGYVRKAFRGLVGEESADTPTQHAFANAGTE